MLKSQILCRAALGWTGLACLAIPRASRADVEPLPAHLHGRSAIAPGQISAVVASR
jgi:hypothetical protein